MTGADHKGRHKLIAPSNVGFYPDQQKEDNRGHCSSTATGIGAAKTTQSIADIVDIGSALPIIGTISLLLLPWLLLLPLLSGRVIRVGVTLSLFMIDWSTGRKLR